MGIKQLMSLINEKAATAVRKVPLETYIGRIIACDASMAMYQFIIATQFSSSQGLAMLTDDQGTPTAHLLGLFNRTILFLEHGVKPVWVFDGKPPVMKSGELERRKQAKEEAKEGLEAAKEEGNMEAAAKFAQRTVHISREMTEDAKLMLRLMGVPVIEAPGEAEAQCSSFVTLGSAYGVASEDLDSLTFGAKYLLRGFNSKKEPITEVCLEEVLRAFEMPMQEFVDLCILCGSDYTDAIQGVGPVTAFKFIKKYHSIEAVLAEWERKQKYKVPANFNYEAARALFSSPDVLPPDHPAFSWQAPSDDQLKEFLVGSKGFAAVRVDSGLARMKKVQGKPAQTRLENFFGNAVVKRRSEPGSVKSNAKKQRKPK